MPPDFAPAVQQMRADVTFAPQFGCDIVQLLADGGEVEPESAARCGIAAIRCGGARAIRDCCKSGVKSGVVVFFHRSHPHPSREGGAW